LAINPFSALYGPLIHFRRRIAHQSIFGVVLPINPFTASFCPLIHLRRRFVRRRKWIDGQYDAENGLMGNTTPKMY
jgi:hypothetical protein